MLLFLKGLQTATDVGIKAVPITANAIRGTAVAGVQVAKQVGLSAVTVAQSYNVIKTMNIAPVSKQAMYVMKANAISTGLRILKFRKELLGQHKAL